MKLKTSLLAFSGLLLTACGGSTPTVETKDMLTTVGNPYLPLWEHIPDGEPYV